MSFVQFRDTVLGQLIRSASKNRPLRYPDEADIELWHSAVHQDVSSAPSEKDVDVESDAGLAAIEIPPAETHRKEPVLVGWYGALDAENPQNWSSAWKAFIVGQICLMNLSFYMASSIVTPGELSIMEDFDVSRTVATLGLSLFSIGYGLGPMLWSPLAEMPKVGRRNIYVATMAIFVLLQLPTGYAVNMPMYLVFRFLAGFVGSPAIAVGGATIADMYPPAQLAYGFTVYAAFGVCGPVFGPLLGGFAARAHGWRLTIWIIAWLGAFTTVVLFMFMPETGSANILYRRAKRLREFTGLLHLRSQSEIDAAGYTSKDHRVALARAFTLTFFEPIVFFLDLYTALLYGVLFTWFESFPLVFGDIYHFDMGQQGLVFLGIFLGTLITVPISLIWNRYRVIPLFEKGTFQPEEMLPITFLGAAALPICLFWYGWSAATGVHFMVPIIGSSLFAVSLVTLFPPVLNYLGIAYPKYVASIFAGNGLFRATFGAIFPLFARDLFERLGVGGGNSLLGGIAICFIPLPWVAWKYGPKLRQMSKNARHDV